MTMQLIVNSPLNTHVRQSLEQSLAYPFLNKALERLHGNKVFLLGGGVREPAVSARYPELGRLAPDDYDLLVHDLKDLGGLETALRGLNGMRKNRFNHPKWCPVEGVEIDIMPLSSFQPDETRFGAEGPSLKNILDTSPLITGAIACDMPYCKTIFDAGTLNAIERREVELWKPDAENQQNPHILMYQAVKQARKLGFTVGPRMQQFIREYYTPSLDQRLAEYLNYKDKKADLGLVLERIKTLAYSPSQT